MILLVVSKGPDQTARMCRLIRAFAARIYLRTRFCMARVHISVGVLNFQIAFSITPNKIHEVCPWKQRTKKKTLFSISTLHITFLHTFYTFIFIFLFQSYVNCTMGVYSLGPILMCFGGVSALASLVIGCIAQHIKRFAFITAGATFNVGLLIVLWLWKPAPSDIPNFFVVAACLGLCDAIWQTQTYSKY